MHLHTETTHNKLPQFKNRFQKSHQHSSTKKMAHRMNNARLYQCLQTALSEIKNNSGRPHQHFPHQTSLTGARTDMEITKLEIHFEILINIFITKQDSQEEAFIALLIFLFCHLNAQKRMHCSMKVHKNRITGQLYQDLFQDHPQKMVIGIGAG